MRAFDRFQDRLQSDKSGKTQPDKAQLDKSQLPKSQPNPLQSSFSPLEQSTVGSRLDSGFQNPVDRRSSSTGATPLPPQTLFTLVDRIHQAEDLNALFQSTVTLVQQQLQVERTLLLRLQTERHGTVVAEAVKEGYTPSLGEDLPILAFKPQATSLHPYAVLEATQPALTPYQVQLLERFQVKSSLALPIEINGQRWGALVVQHCTQPRQWQDADILLLYQLIMALQLKMQPLEFRSQRQRKARMEPILSRILEATVPALNPDQNLANLCQQLREFYKTDRVAVYRFHSDWSGEFIAESVGAGWRSLIQAQANEQDLTSADIVGGDRCTTKQIGDPMPIDDKDKILQDTQGSTYASHQIIKRVDDIYKAGFSDCYIQTLERYQARAYLIAPVFEGDYLWGLIAVYHCTSPRTWTDAEATLLSLLSDRLSTVLKQLDFVARIQEKSHQLQTQSQQLTRSVEQSIAYSDLIYKLGTTLIQDNFSIDQVLPLVVRELRKQLQTDRVALYRFQADWSGEFIVEDMSATAEPLVGMRVKLLKDDSLPTVSGRQYQRKEVLSVAEVSPTTPADFPMELLQEWGTKAYLAVPVFKEEQLWGLIIAFQTDAPRHWEQIDINLIAQVGVQVGLALQQADYLKQLRHQSQHMAQSIEQGKYVASIVDRIRRSLDLQQVLKTTTREIRRFLDVDRVAIFKFETDTHYSDGATVAEDVRPGYTSALAVKVTDHCFSEGFAEQYRQGRVWAIADIYQAGLQNCYIEVLAQFQVRANLVVPLLKGDELWGLFCIHHCSEAREWQESEIEFAKQIAAQLNVAIQQGEYLGQLQQQSL
ncbi:MAG TPA: GAF domain-containing protein, partial [Allocoleopsis sp.]